MSLWTSSEQSRKSGLTFAPEAGTQRLRDVINKNVSKKRLLIPALRHSTNGWTSVKLYFMMGLPTETMEDVEGIADLGMQVVHAFYKNPNRQREQGFRFQSAVPPLFRSCLLRSMGTGGYNGKLES